MEYSLYKSNIVKLNNDEVVKLADWFDLSNDHVEFSKQLCDKFGCEIVCITRGGEGAFLNLKGEIAEHSGYKVDIKDTVGSGDAFLAALISGIQEKKSASEIIDFANATGAFVASRNGATPELDLNLISQIQIGKN